MTIQTGTSPTGGKQEPALEPLSPARPRGSRQSLSLVPSTAQQRIRYIGIHFLHAWVVTRYADVMMVLQHFSANRTPTPEQLTALGLSKLMPLHR